MYQIECHLTLCEQLLDAALSFETEWQSGEIMITAQNSENIY